MSHTDEHTYLQVASSEGNLKSLLRFYVFLNARVCSESLRLKGVNSVKTTRKPQKSYENTCFGP